MNNKANEGHHDKDWWTDILVKTVLAFGGVIVTLAGVVIGIWSRGIEQNLVSLRDSHQAIWRTLNERSSIPSRTTELEKRTDDQERRLRELEINGHRSRYR